MYGKKKQNKDRRSNDAHQQLLSMGLVPDNDNSDDEAALEAELQKLMYGGSKSAKPKKRKSEPPPPDLDKMVAACMADVSDDDNEDASEDDADLLNELAEFEDDNDDDDVEMPAAAPPPKVEPRKPTYVAPIAPSSSASSCVPDQCAGQSLLSVIETRLEMYTTAEKNAKQSGETSRARRFGRGLATLKDLQRKVKAGKAVDENDIPPALASFPVTTPKEEVVPEMEKPPSRVVPAPTTTPSSTVATPTAAVTTVTESPEKENPIFNELLKKRAEYKDFALNSKKEGNKSSAMLGLSGVKQCDELLQRAKNGETVQLDSLPNLTSEPQPVGAPQSQPGPSQPPPPPTLERSFSRDAPIQIPDNPEDIPEEKPVVVAKTADEALRQRLEKYKQVCDSLDLIFMWRCAGYLPYPKISLGKPVSLNVCYILFRPHFSVPSH